MKLVKVSEVLRELGEHDRTEKKTAELIRRYGIKVEHEMPYGRGVLRMMSEDQAKELIAKHKKPEPEAIESLDEARALATNRECREACARLGTIVGALTAEVKAQRATLESNSQAIELLIKQSNLLNDQLKRVLKELGVTTSL